MKQLAYALSQNNIDTFNDNLKLQITRRSPKLQYADGMMSAQKQYRTERKPEINTEKSMFHIDRLGIPKQTNIPKCYNILNIRWQLYNSYQN